ncbi:hypothetical protein SprV_0301153300 [Sparganum proliferum]
MVCCRPLLIGLSPVYEQKEGTPMGSPLSGLIAEAVLQRLERLVFSSYPPNIWARYVDDTFVIIKRSDVQTFKALLNSMFPDIQFTMEEELNNQLAFLDVQVTKLEDGKIRTTVYRKATNTRRILHFKSNHPVGHKRSCIITLSQRVQTHCSDDNGRKEEIKYVGETGKRLGTRLHEHQLAINRKDKLSMVYGHVKQQNHNFAFEKAMVIGRANDKMARLMLDCWFSTGTLNRALDLHPAYQMGYKNFIEPKVISTSPHISLCRC